MEKTDFSVFELETHETKDVSDSHINGELTILWRNWDKIIHDPEMVYVNSVNPGEIKGPHLHKNRTSYFYCLHGKITLIIKDEAGEFHEIETNSDDKKLVMVSNGIAAAFVNPSNEISKVLVMANISWKPNDNEMQNVDFEDYDWTKWNK